MNIRRYYLKQDIFLALLSSTVLTAIITGILGAFVNGKKLETDHITNERKTWREQIRILSKKINLSKNLKELKNVLSELKLSINGYGLLKHTQYLSDGHLWGLILEIEQLSSANKQTLTTYKKFLIELLSVLLKYDWERSKLEIKGTSKVTSNWDIEITNVTAGTPTGSAENATKPSWKATSASMEANLYDKGDAMEYDVTIENKGTIDAKLNDILTNLENSNSDAVIITFSGYTKGEVLKAKESKIVHVKIAYNPDYEGEVRGNLLVYEGKVIGGDICSLTLNGFMHGFKNPNEK